MPRSNKPGFAKPELNKPDLNKPRQLFLASQNHHKLAELRALLPGSWQLISAAELVPSPHWDETGTTFAANAAIKCAALAPYAQRACILGEDSGLCIAALNGAPGVYSARYAGDDADPQAALRKVLAAMQGIPLGQRQAYFHCSLHFVDEQGRHYEFTGRCDGHIPTQATGQNGFGYDSIFVPQGFACTFAELSSEEKNRISHRHQALAAWAKAVNS